MKLRWFIGGALIAAVLQSVAVGEMIFDRAKLLQNGKEVVLQSGMVDPRDLFRGHYVTLNLAIGRIPSKGVEVVGKLERRREVFVALKASDKSPFWIAEALYAQQPEGIEQPFIRGELSAFPRKGFENGSYRIQFPVDRFFAEKGRAKELEKVRRNRALGVIVALSSDGEAAIKGISVGGELIYSESIY